MESAPTTPAAAADDSPRIKFLCSFGGTFLPRPLDGKLRYVGGDTRIVTVPRDFTYEDLLARLREVFEGISIIKYQQPDEDLDALVTVVNDDDIMNMMEEYEKLGASGDGYTKLRIFLFSQPPEHDMSSINPHDDRENERRYVDALNKLPDSKSPPPPEFSEHFFVPPSIDCGIYNQLNVRHIDVPNSSSPAQRYGEIDVPRSPPYFSPGHYPAFDSREFPSSPASNRYRLTSGEINDRVPDDYGRLLGGHQLHQYEHNSSPPTENYVWIPPGAIVQEKAGFPNNLGHPHNLVDSNSICEHCQMAFQRNQVALSDARYLDPRWRHMHPHMDQPSIPNEYVGNFTNSCAECYNAREQYMLNQDIKIDHGMYVKEQNEPHYPFYNEIHSHDKGWFVHDHQVRTEDARVRPSGVGRTNEPYIADGNIVNFSFAHGNVFDENSLSSNALNCGSRPNLCQVSEAGNEAFLTQQTVGAGSYANFPNFEETIVRHGNQPNIYGDGLYQVPLNLPPIQSLRRKAQVTSRPGTSYEPSTTVPNGGFARPTPEGSPRFTCAWFDEQIPNEVLGHNNVMGQKALGCEESSATDFYHHVARPTLKIPSKDGLVSLAPVPGQCSPSNLPVEAPYEAASIALKPSFPIDNEQMTCNPTNCHRFPMMESDMTSNKQTTEKINLTEVPGANHSDNGEEPDGGLCKNGEGVELDLNGLKLTEIEENTRKPCHAANVLDAQEGDISEDSLSFLPELLASAKKAVLEGAEEVVVKDKASLEVPCPSKREPSHDCLHKTAAAECDADIDGDGEQEKLSKIEPTTAEAEALSKGLQTIKNDDLEEIRELGCGTFGSVYHGKWRGSDVAIKRIKASCFAGRPSERERLIADFWKEALILSSLHHPNVVSFYGVVRDGPDGSLATVTEFMVNGSLKQFLQKKDRTIDRRKRLIIAMDASFGMEYLHSKNIVHFDLKCENLLVNMRDPHRPICKIGDLGLSKVKQHTLVSGGIRGTLPWMAPELLSGKSNMVSEKIDVYSFGIVMWELLTGEEPYADMRGASIIGGIVNNTLRPKVPTWCDPEWKSLMESCWSTDPASRPSFSEISQKLRKMAAAINLK